MSVAPDVVRPDNRDLEGLPADRWEHLAVPPGWEPIAEICREINRGLANSVRDTVDAIRSEVDVYRRCAVPREDLIASVECNLEMLLLGIAERRGPTPGEIEARSTLGSRRAHQGFPVDALLQAYHVGYRDLWKRFLKYTDDEQVSHLLLGAASTMWEWTHQVTDAIGRAHAETTHLLAVRAASVRHRFLELLLTGDVHSDAVRTVCGTLGFDARGTFRAAVILGVEPDETMVPRFQGELNLVQGNHQAIPHGSRMVVVSQGGDPQELHQAVTRLYPASVVGVGLARPGLAGARLSVGDAERAADLGTEAGLSTFEASWLWAVLLRESDRLAAFLEQGRTIAREHRAMAETVEAYAASGFSVSAAARQLHVHPNTATYRLDRWRELTGWDPRSFDGLARSLAALRLQR
ncbi:MAG TPA: helix-turn-helix domain-containing protein [Euzebyales bacterium]|nr:helix-turn-helix domain-containing protein [Euzebyales bacterium]